MPAVGAQESDNEWRRVCNKLEADGLVKRDLGEDKHGEAASYLRLLQPPDSATLGQPQACPSPAFLGYVQCLVRAGFGGFSKLGLQSGHLFIQSSCVPCPAACMPRICATVPCPCHGQQAACNACAGRDVSCPSCNAYSSIVT